MDNTIKIRQAYGFGGKGESRIIWKPANEAAIYITGISRTTTLSNEVIRCCEKLGFTIEIATPEPTWNEGERE
jgi:hypothetical protein